MKQNQEYIRINEKNTVEEPFLQQLAAMKRLSEDSLYWDIARLDKSQQPEDTGRTSFSEVVMQDQLYESLKIINKEITESQLEKAIGEITDIQGNDLIGDNQKILNLLLKGKDIPTEDGRDSVNIRYIDFDTPENNSFIAVSQLKIQIPGSDGFIYPDIVCFVNGLPLVIIECKSPKLQEPIAEAIEQLMRYAEQRGDYQEGSKYLFAYNQFTVATCRSKAKFGTITTNTENLFFRWTDPYPITIDQLINYTKDEQSEYFVDAEGKDDSDESLRTAPNDQQRLVQGMLYPINLLNILKSFTIFTTTSKGETIKVVGRYQQYRAVYKAIERIETGKNKEDKGGIVWHTQGSGKSLTMVFLMREIWSRPKLMDYKFVLLTDREQLDKQLMDNAVKTDFTIAHPNSIVDVKTLLKQGNWGIASIMIQKFQIQENEIIFPELNINDRIIVLTDEAHRSQYKTLKANFDKALPNATNIGFTGTPIDKTEETFGSYIDKYTMRQAIDDGVTLEIVYEGRAIKTEIKNKKEADKAFLDVFNEVEAENLVKAFGYTSRRAYLEAQNVVQEKAKNMLEHYLSEVFPNGFKAQVVASTKEAAHRYKQTFDKEIKRAYEVYSKDNKYNLNLEWLRNLRAEVIISKGESNDPDHTHLQQYYNKQQQDNHIASFLVDYGKEKDGIKGDVGILIVVHMLTVGFDAPIEQVMYLDKVVTMHNLLQTVTRVNRVGDPAKEVGFVVDYVGVGDHLKEALDNYKDREQKEILSCFKDINELTKELYSAKESIEKIFKDNKIFDLEDIDAIYNLFYDEDIRFKFIEAYRAYTKALNNIFPRKEALDFMPDYYIYSEINIQAGLHIRDQRMSMRGIPEKIRAITDQYLQAKGIDTKVEPISITSEEFAKDVEAKKSSKVKAAQIEHAIRHYINIHFNDDPELFSSFSEMMENILQEFANRWDIIYQKMSELRQRIINRYKEPTYGLDQRFQMPYFRILKNNIFGKEHELSEDEISKLVAVTKEIYDKIILESSAIGFWRNPSSQSALRGAILEILLSKEHNLYTIPDVFSKRNEIVSRILEKARPH